MLLKIGNLAIWIPRNQQIDPRHQRWRL